MTAISFVTTCKGRLHHLQQTLPAIVAEAPDEIVVVDYACPQGSGDWVEANFPNVKVVRVEDDPGFCLPRARNVGARHSTSPWIVFIDADVMVSPGLLEWLRRHIQPWSFFRASPVNGVRDKETWGTAVCSREAFEYIGGYDEVFRGWGGEDADLYYRLNQAGLGERPYPAGFVRAIPHDDAERVTFHRVKDKQRQQIINQFYAAAKRQALMVLGRETLLPFNERQLLMERITNVISQWNEGDSGPDPTITVNVKGVTLLHKPFKIHKSCSLTLTLSCK